MRDPSALQVESFLEMMSAERGAATNTLQSYERDLEDVRSFLNERNVRLTEATPDDLRAYLGHLAKQGFAASSQARRKAGRSGWSQARTAICAPRRRPVASAWQA